MPLDKKDRLIISALQQDARQRSVSTALVLSHPVSKAAYVD